MSIENIRRLKEQANEPKPKKAYQIPKVSKKRQKKLEEQKDMIKLDHEFYEEHWRACPHKCEQCGLNLGKEPLTIFFHHALPKRNYPQFRHTHENLIVLCGNCHSQAEVDIDKVPIVKRRTVEIEKLLNS
jgi:5-methylcytosine-specific restriction endonuclease McrA